MPEEELDLSLLYDWGQEVAKTVECYQGTVYYTFTLPADCAYFIYDLQSFTSCGFSLTPNGYAVVNLGALSSQPYSYILDCSEDLNSPNNAYLLSSRKFSLRPFTSPRSCVIIYCNKGKAVPVP